MLKRILSGAAGIAFILAILFLSLNIPIVIDIFISLVCVIAVGEFINAVDKLKLIQLSIPSIAFAFVYPMLLSYGMSNVIWYAYTAVMLSMLIFFHTKISFKDFAYTYSMSLIITYGLSAIIYMKEMDIKHSVMYFVISLALPWLADAGGYFVGIMFGKHKMCPNISPKKTIEGAFGGVAFCVGACCLIGLIFQNFIYANSVHINYLNLLILAFAASLLSILGDLSFSLIKRSCKIKDYGNIIPGHGGVLDRFDSVIFVAPFLMIMITYLPILY